MMLTLTICSTKQHFLKRKKNIYTRFLSFQGKDFPVIQGDGGNLASCDTFNVVIDGIAVSSSSNLMTALSIYFAGFYIFNLAYPSCLKKTCTFFQKVIFNTQDNLKPERAVISLLEKLNQTN